MDERDREPCFHCGEAALREARLCAHYGRSLLVDVHLQQAPADPRQSYQLARALSALGPGILPFLDLQKALAGARPLVARGVTRAMAARVAGTAAGFHAAIEPPRPAHGAGSAGTQRTLLAAGALAVAAALAGGVGLLWREVSGGGAPPPAAVSAAAATPQPASSETAAPALTPREIAARALPSLVSLRCAQSVGAGFFVDSELLLTNAHVLCHDGTGVTVAFKDGRTLPGAPVREDKALDLALVRVPGANAVPLELGDAGELALGDRVIAAGSPVGFEFSVSEGLVSNLDQVIFGVAYVQTDAKINPGNSGGPLLDARGRVVGIVSLKHAQAEGIAWALPINYAYSGGAPFVPPPVVRPPSEGWQTMLARAEKSNSQVRSELFSLELRPGLVGARLDRYQRLVVRVLQPARTDPGPTDVKLKIWSGDEVVCTLGGAVQQWKPFESRQASSPEEQRLMAWLESNGFDARLYIGEAAMSWNFCPHDRMARGAVIELEGADERADKLRLR